MDFLTVSVVPEGTGSGRVLRVIPGDQDREGELFLEAVIGGGLYRERFVRKAELEDGIAGDSVADIDRWTRHDARSLATGQSCRRGIWRQPYRELDGSVMPASFGGVEHQMYAPIPPRVYLTTAEAMMEWPIYQAGLQPINPADIAEAARACRQVSDDLMREVRENAPDVRALGLPDGEAIYADDVDAARFWRRLSWRLARAAAHG